MGEIGGDFDLPEEAVGAEGVGQLGVEHLEGDGPAVAEVAGEVDRGHAAPAELALEAIAIGESGLEVREKVGHATLDGSRMKGGTVEYTGSRKGQREAGLRPVTL